MGGFFYLKSCDTCRRILKELDLPAAFELREIKSSPITANELEEIKKHFSSYEELFNKRAIKFRSMDASAFVDSDYQRLILSDYTFLKRPVLLLGDKAIAGNSKSIVELMSMSIEGVRS